MLPATVAARDERGFTLIEVLVVILIVGVLAAIAIPSFLNQRSKAFDASAKELAHSAQVAAESYATDHSGSYANLTPSILNQYETTIQIASGGGNAYVSSVSNASSSGYTITVNAANGTDTFSITRQSGSFIRTCTVNGAAGTGGGCQNGSW